MSSDNLRPPSSVEERPPFKRSVVGSNPTGVVNVLPHAEERLVFKLTELYETYPVEVHSYEKILEFKIIAFEDLENKNLDYLRNYYYYLPQIARKDPMLKDKNVRVRDLVVIKRKYLEHKLGQPLYIRRVV